MAKTKAQKQNEAFIASEIEGCLEDLKNSPHKREKWQISRYLTGLYSLQYHIYQYGYDLDTHIAIEEIKINISDGSISQN